MLWKSNAFNLHGFVLKYINNITIRLWHEEAPPDSDKITVDPVTCVITSKESLDYEVATSHTITIQAVDTGFIPARTAQTTLVITVDDENDNKPVTNKSLNKTHL